VFPLGFFDRFKKDKSTPAAEIPKAEPKPCGPVIVEIARLISSGDEAVLRDITACVENPRKWFEKYEDDYGFGFAEDLDLVQWVSLARILEEHSWVCERDWKDELEDFLFFVQKLNGFQAQKLTIDPAWLDEEGDIPAWCDVLTEKWASQGVRMAAIDIDSDSYVLFPVSTALLPTLQKLAGEIGRCIDFVGRT